MSFYFPAKKYIFNKFFLAFFAPCPQTLITQQKNGKDGNFCSVLGRVALCILQAGMPRFLYPNCFFEAKSEKSKKERRLRAVLSACGMPGPLAKGRPTQCRLNSARKSRGTKQAISPQIQKSTARCFRRAVPFFQSFNLSIFLISYPQIPREPYASMGPANWLLYSFA